jgi:hypothetical protein
MPAQLREGRLEEEAERVFTLKNGKQMRGGEAIAALRGLQALLEQRPYLFRALLAIVQGRAEEAASEDIALLKDGCWLRADNGVLRDTIRDVLLSAYQETPEGPVLTNPFRFRDQGEANQIERIEEAHFNRLIRELRKRDDKGPPPRRG